MRLLLLISLLFPVTGLANQCLESDINTQLQYLRRLSLDIRGTIPTVAEYKRVIAEGQIADDLMDSMLASDGFTQQIRDHHQELLWTNLSNQRLGNNTYQISRPRRDRDAAYFIRAFGRTSRYRQPRFCGGDVTASICRFNSDCGNGINCRAPRYCNGDVNDSVCSTNQDCAGSCSAIVRPNRCNGDPNRPLCDSSADCWGQPCRVPDVSCLDEPARYENGEIMVTCDEVGVCREGWEWITPYWDPSSRIKVCAYDAQVNERGSHLTNATAGTVACDTSFNSRECGCGPNLRNCESRDFARTTQVTTASFREQLLRFMDKIVELDRPYTDILLSRDVEVNGPIAHYHRYHANHGGNIIRASVDPGYPLPEDLEYTDIDSWVPVTRTGLHSGVMTMFGYLMKFQSNRGRANRFHNAFLCQSFQAPKEGLPASDDACHLEPNLTKRCGCKYCHVGVEPDAAYWGRWSEAGVINLDTEAYPKVNTDCITRKHCDGRYARPRCDEDKRPQDADCRVDETCRRVRPNLNCRTYYFVDPRHPDEEPYLGYLLSYVFSDALGSSTSGESDSDYSEHINLGPRALAQQAIDSGRFAQCTVQNLWARIMARPPRTVEAHELAALTEAFVASNYSLRSLTEAIVRSEPYRAGAAHGVLE